MRSLKLLLLAMVVGIFSISVVCAEELNVPQETSTVEYTITEPYAYENLQWGDAFTTEQFNLDQEILGKMTTEALMYTVLYCPGLTNGNYYEWAVFESWVDVYRNECNVFDAFIRRPDAIDVISEHIISIDPHKNDNITEIPAEYEYNRASQEAYNWWVDVLDQDSSINLMKAVFCEQGKKDMFQSCFREITENSTLSPESVTDIVDCGNGVTGTLKYLFTPKGTPVAAIYDKVPELSLWAKQNSKNEVTARKNEGAEFISAATRKYNCHSYAWYWPAVGNLYWINPEIDIDPGTNQVQKYIDDGSYVRVRSGEQLKTGYIAVYGDFKHSAIVTSVDSDGTVWMNSKWGEGCLVKHKAQTSMYPYPITYYKPAG